MATEASEGRGVYCILFQVNYVTSLSALHLFLLSVRIRTNAQGTVCTLHTPRALSQTALSTADQEALGQNAPSEGGADDLCLAHVRKQTQGKTTLQTKCAREAEQRAPRDLLEALDARHLISL